MKFPFVFINETSILVADIADIDAKRYAKRFGWYAISAEFLRPLEKLSLDSGRRVRHGTFRPVSGGMFMDEEAAT